MAPTGPPPANRVAVVVPVFCAERWLAATLESLATQTEPGVQVLVIDDGSTDASADLAEGFEDRIEGLRVVRQENAGRATARNRGLALATARYVCFLDHDDVVHPDALRQQADALDACPEIAVAYSSVVEFEESADGVRQILGPRPDPDAPLDERILEGAYSCLPSATLQTRESALAVGGFATGFRSSEDVDFYIRLAYAGYRFAHVPSPPLLYRIHSGQGSCDDIVNRQEMLVALGSLLGRMPRDHPRRPKLRDRMRFLRLLQAGTMDARGRTHEARRMVLASVSFPPRLGHVLETLRLLRRPARVLDWIGHPPESRERRHDRDQGARRA